MSESFALRNRFRIDRTSVNRVKLPQGTFVKSIGSTTQQYQFEGEEELHTVLFAVLPNCVHDIILGKTFLNLTKTLTDFRYRVQKRFVSIASRLTWLLLTGHSNQRVAGSINGKQSFALPDTGSDIMVLSRQYAESCGFEIQRSPGYREWLELADGSSVCTYGTVLGATWRFGDGYEEMPYVYDFHVLEDLSCDVILSNEFLFDTAAFSAHQDWFIDLPDDQEDCSELRLIRLMYKTLLDTSPELSESELEHARRADADDLIDSLAEPQREAARVQEDRLREQWNTRVTPPHSNGHTNANGTVISSSKKRWLSLMLRYCNQRLFRRKKGQEELEHQGAAT